MKASAAPTSKKKLYSKIVDIESIDQGLKNQMFALLEKYYVDVEKERFASDLKDKTHIFLFYERGTREFVGFSTISRKPIPALAPGLFLFSGDTVLREDCWGSKVLQKCFSRFVFRSKLLTPHLPLYWMLMSKGFKTYMMMRKNFKYSFPNTAGRTPALFQRVLDHYYNEKFGDVFNPASGLIVFPRSLGAVKGNFADPTEKQLANPDVEYFLKRNPAYKEGVELACIAEICFRDFMGLFLKFFVSVGRRRRHSAG